MYRSAVSSPRIQSRPTTGVIMKSVQPVLLVGCPCSRQDGAVPQPLTYDHPPWFPKAVSLSGPISNCVDHAAIQTNAFILLPQYLRVLLICTQLASSFCRYTRPRAAPPSG